MKIPKQNRLLILVLMLTCCGTGFSQTAKVVQSLPDDSFIVSINGKEYRAVNADKIRGIEKQKFDLETAQKVNAELTGQVNEALLERDLAKANQSLIQQKADSFEADFKRSQEDAKRNFGLLMGERELRTEAQQFIPHGKASGFGGKVLSFLDSGYGQSLFKLVIPTAQAVKVFSARCQ